MTKPSVLFLCTGNSCRSQMAEAWLRKHAGERFEVFSAGTEPKPINPLTYRVMEEVGEPLVGHRSKLVNELRGKVHFDYLITVCDEADKNCPVGLVKTEKRMHWFFEGPAAATGDEQTHLVKFREVRDLIEKRIQDWLNHPEG